MGQIHSVKRTELRVEGRLYRGEKKFSSRKDRSLFAPFIDILYNMKRDNRTMTITRKYRYINARDSSEARRMRVWRVK